MKPFVLHTALTPLTLESTDTVLMVEVTR